MLLHARVHVQACLILPASSSHPICITGRSPGASTPGSRHLITVTAGCCHTRLLFMEAAPAARAPAHTVPGSGPAWPTENSFTSLRLSSSKIPGSWASMILMAQSFKYPPTATSQVSGWSWKPWAGMGVASTISPKSHLYSLRCPQVSLLRQLSPWPGLRGTITYASKGRESGMPVTGEEANPYNTPPL